MRNYKAQSLTVIRKNGRAQMTQMSNEDPFRNLQEWFKKGRSFFKTVRRSVLTFLNGTGRKDYVALTSGRLQGSLQVGRR